MEDVSQEIQTWSASGGVYYSAVFIVGFICGISRTLRNGDYLGVGNCIVVGLFAGCLSSALVAVLAGNPTDFPDRSFFYLGMSAFVGLSGKESIALINFAMKQVFLKLGIELESERKQTDRINSQDND